MSGLGNSSGQRGPEPTPVFTPEQLAKLQELIRSASVAQGEVTYQRVLDTWRRQRAVEAESTGRCGCVLCRGK